MVSNAILLMRPNSTRSIFLSFCSQELFTVFKSDNIRIHLRDRLVFVSFSGFPQSDVCFLITALLTTNCTDELFHQCELTLGLLLF